MLARGIFRKILVSRKSNCIYFLFGGITKSIFKVPALTVVCLVGHFNHLCSFVRQMKNLEALGSTLLLAREIC